MRRLLGKISPRIVRRFKKQEDGATAVEFGLVAGPFFLLIFAIIETSLYFFAGQFLESGVDRTLRLFRTGQFDASTTNAQFRQALCDEVGYFLDCADIRTYVQVAAEFDELTDPPDPDPSGELPGDQFDPGIGPKIVMQISASYKWPVYTNFAAPLKHSSNGNFALLRVVAVTRTEPYN